ncbi:MAG: hypothetical protein L6Q33_06365 [Bacteriovoracaceae bacterium]|jgi:shikimate kinase|nr:hypothetical protein [Bacteriovoracaceae bacterium]
MIKVQDHWQKIVIVGFSGAGKSHLLREWSESLMPSFLALDLDDEILKKYGKPEDKELGKFISRVGFTEFRRLEKELLNSFLNQSSERLLIALGGGAFDHDIQNITNENPSILSLFLDTPFDICYERICQDTNRPLVQLGKAKLHELYLARLEIYRLAKKIIRPEELKFIDAL